MVAGEAFAVVTVHRLRVNFIDIVTDVTFTFWIRIVASVATPVVPAVWFLTSTDRLSFLVTFVNINTFALTVLVLVEGTGGSSSYHPDSTSSSSTSVVIWIWFETLRAPGRTRRSFLRRNNRLLRGRRSFRRGFSCRLGGGRSGSLGSWFRRGWFGLADVGNFVKNLILGTDWLTFSVNELFAFLAADVRAVSVVACVVFAACVFLFTFVDVLAGTLFLVKCVAFVAVACVNTFSKSLVDTFSVFSTFAFVEFALIVIDTLVAAVSVDALLVLGTFVDVCFALIDVGTFATGILYCVSCFAFTCISTWGVYTDRVLFANVLLLTFVNIFAFARGLVHFVTLLADALVFFRILLSRR